MCPDQLTISDLGLRFIARHEGLRLTKYLDQGGKPTIGYGHLILPGEMHETITEDYAHTLLAQDSEAAQTAVRILVKPIQPLAQHQFDALVDFTFNLGAHNLAQSTLRKHINEGLSVYESLWTAWNLVGGKPLAALTRRRFDEYNLYATGKYT